MITPFPAVVYAATNTIERQIGHVVSEAAEVLQATNPRHRLEEIIDLLHSADTLRRIAEREYGADQVEATRLAVIRKNYRRGYYNLPTLCETCARANVSCPIYPQQTIACVEYRERSSS